VDARLGLLQFRHQPGQRFGTVDQDVERSFPAAAAHRQPSHPRSIQCHQPADPLERAPMVRTDGAANRRSQMAVRAEDDVLDQKSIVA
jgi:hypothetical protein